MCSRLQSDGAISQVDYAYNSANQRTAITKADNSRWAYGYDTLGQVTSGKKYWSNASIVAGQQFEYGFDDIGIPAAAEECACKQPTLIGAHRNFC